MKNFFRKNIFLYLAVIFFTIMCCFYFQIRIDRVTPINGLSECNISFKDNILYILGGIPKLKNVEDRNFKIPFIWITLQLFILASGYFAPYVKNSIKDEWILIKSNSRKHYMICQIRDVFLKVSMIYLCVFLGVMIYTVFYSTDFSSIHYNYFSYICGVKIEKDIGLWIAVFPWIYGIFEAIIQIFLNIYVGRVLAFAFILGYNILCVYITSPFLLGNISMLFRNSLITDNGINITAGLVIGILLSILFTCESIRKINYIDFL